jgi:hypothetical protein
MPINNESAGYDSTCDVLEMEESWGATPFGRPIHDEGVSFKREFDWRWYVNKKDGSWLIEKSRGTKEAFVWEHKKARHS